MAAASTPIEPTHDRAPVATPVPVPVVVATLALCGVLVVSQLYVTIPLAPVVGRVFGVSPLAAAWIGSAFGFAYALGNLVFGPLSDRYGRLGVLVPGLAALAVATLAVGASPSFPALVALRALQGFVGATFPPAALAYLAETLPPRARATGIAVVSAGFLLAGLVGQIYAGALAPAYGWRWVFWALVGTLVLAVAAIRRLPAGTAQRASPVTLRQAFARMAPLLGAGPLLVVYAVSLALLLPFVAMYSGLDAVATGRYGIAGGGLTLLRLAGLPGILLSPLAGGLIHRYGARVVARAALLLAAGGLVLEAAPSSLVVLLIGSGVFVAGIAAAVPAVISLVSALGGDARGAAIALYGCLIFVGASLGPLVATMLRPAGFAVLCLALAAMLLVAAGVLPRRGGRRLSGGDA